jgi:hypothetical protein
MRRYQSAPTPELQALYMAAVRRYDELISMHCVLISRPQKRLIRSYNRELRIRARKGESL